MRDVHAVPHYYYQLDNKFKVIQGTGELFKGRERKEAWIIDSIQGAKILADLAAKLCTLSLLLLPRPTFLQPILPSIIVSPTAATFPPSLASVITHK